MKKSYVLLLITAITILGVTAQPFQKGDKLLGGSIGYTVNRSTLSAPPSPSNQNRDYRYYNFNISPSIGFFTRPNRLSGFSLLFGFGSSLGSSNGGQKTYNYGASFFRQYWTPLGKNFYFNIQGRTGAAYGRTLYEFPSQFVKDEYRNATAFLAVEPGFAYRMKRRLVLDMYYSGFLYAGYTFQERRYNSTSYSRDYSVSAITGLQNFSLGNVLFGFRYLL